MSSSAPSRPNRTLRYSRKSRRFSCAWALLLLLAAGCSTVRVTDPPRTATEQFLISGAATQAIAQLSAEALRDRKVFVDPTYLVSTDQAFVLGEVRSRLLQSGVRLVNTRPDAQVILEVRSGGIGIDRYESLLGVPALVLPSQAATAAGGGAAAAASNIITPELAILKNTKQYGFASVAFVAYWADTGDLLASSGPYVGRTRRKDFWFFGFGPRTVGDIPPADRSELPGEGAGGGGPSTPAATAPSGMR